MRLLVFLIAIIIVGCSEGEKPEIITKRRLKSITAISPQGVSNPMIFSYINDALDEISIFKDNGSLQCSIGVRYVDASIKLFQSCDEKEGQLVGSYQYDEGRLVGFSSTVSEYHFDWTSNNQIIIIDSSLVNMLRKMLVDEKGNIVEMKIEEGGNQLAKFEYVFDNNQNPYQGLTTGNHPNFIRFFSSNNFIGMKVYDESNNLVSNGAIHYYYDSNGYPTKFIGDDGFGAEFSYFDY